MINDHNPSFVVIINYINYRQADANFNNVTNQNAQDLCDDSTIVSGGRYLTLVCRISRRRGWMMLECVKSSGRLWKGGWGTPLIRSCNQIIWAQGCKSRVLATGLVGGQVRRVDYCHQ